ncbi:Zn-ribbon domain-containing OB-fold protein [Natrononativus amylolyticus]|uniref:Zn-ribbon domain-containing OB-fold protein n=1 Tax=Natrononativus amylolyticus TaxID=2963434 RepID=UPI0020CE55CC|nr:OB-fold domain-containing protein [Natrononativus amylolyticus]
MTASGDETGDLLRYDEWAAALEDGDLRGQRCPDCGHETAAPKAACGRCGARDLETVSLPTEGTVYTETTVAVAPEGFDGGYRVAVVDLGEARVLARLADDCEAGIGDPVEFSGTVSGPNGEPAPLFD